MSIFDISPLKPIIDNTLGKVIDKALSFITSPEDRAKAALELRQMDLTEEKMQFDQAIAQINVNIEQAKSEHWFAANARPATMWICNIAIGYAYVLQPLLTFVVCLWKPEFKAPGLEIQDLMALLGALLGTGTMRTIEKSKIINAQQ